MSALAGVRDVTTAVLYDTQQQPNTTGVSKLTYFQQARGVGLHLTNLKVPGQLPGPEAFLVRTMRIAVTPSGAYGTATTGPIAFSAQPSLVDVLKCLHTASVYFEVGSKPYVDYWPMWMFSAGQTIAATNFGPNTATAAPNYLGNGTPGTVVNFKTPIPISTTEPFRGELIWAAAPSLSVPLSLQFILGGSWSRGVQ